MSTDNLNPYPGNLKHHKVEPFLSDKWMNEGLREIMPECVNAIDVAAACGDLSREIRDKYEAELQRLRGLLDEATDMLYEGAGYADEVTDSEGADEFARRARTFLAKLKK